MIFIFIVVLPSTMLNNVNSTINIIGYAVPNNCAVMYLGDIEEAIQRRNKYLVKNLLIANKKKSYNMKVVFGQTSYTTENLTHQVIIKGRHLGQELGKMDHSYERCES